MTTDRRRRLPRVTARLRILAWIALLLTLAGATAVLVQRRVLLQRLERDVARGLEQEVEELRSLAGGVDPRTGEPFGDDVAAIFDTFLHRNIPADDEVLFTIVDGRPHKVTRTPVPFYDDPALIARWSQLDASERGELATAAGRARYLAVPLAGETGSRATFVVLHFLRGDHDEIDRVTTVSAVVYGGALLVAVGLGWLVAGRVLAPIRDMSDTAREIGQSDFTRRIEIPPTHDEIAELAEVFNAMLDRLDGAFREQRRFLDDAGHELRTPITIVRGHLELESDDPAERHATRELVLDELDRMGRIVDDLLVLARAEQPDALRVEPVDLDLLTSDLYAKARAIADRDWRLAAAGVGVIHADRHRLTQAVVNLLENAARHTAPGDLVELGSALHDGQARIWVRDTGPGVPPAERERIFRRFARAPDGGRAGAAGLGLAIVRAIATAHGGTVEVDGQAGEGATFTITLPNPEDTCPES